MKNKYDRITDSLRLWIDGQCLQTASRMRGIGRYVQEFIAEIAQNHPRVELHVSLNAAMQAEALVAREVLLQWLTPENIHMWQGIVEGPEEIYGYNDRRRLSEIALAYHVVQIDPDIALSASPFETDYAVPLVANGVLRAPVVSIFYDAIPYRFKDRYLNSPSVEAYYNRRLYNYKEYDFNLCISSFAQDELRDILGVFDTVNISAGVSKNFLANLDTQKEQARAKKTLLYVGGFDWRKNVPSIFEAIGLIEEPLRDEIRLEIVGDLGVVTAAEFKAAWVRKGLPERNLILLGHVPDEALVKAYLGASATIQPSFMEGFGLTALESLLCDTPVIASNSGALPEVIPEATVLFDPHDVKDIARHIVRILTDDEHIQRVLSHKAKLIEQFSWNRTVAVAVAAFDELILNRATACDRRRDDVEQSIVSQVEKLKVDKKTIANCLARAELQNVGSDRLIIDATSTVISDGGTGIQRVVNKICQNIPNVGEKTFVAFSNSADGWYPLRGRDLNIRWQDIVNDKDRLVLGERDTVLLLDSSWIYHREYKEHLLKARLRGTKIISCLYDLIPMSTSGFTRVGTPEIFVPWLKSTLEYSTGLVCISKSIADELIATLEAIQFPRRLQVGYWPLGADFVDQAAGSVSAGKSSIEVTKKFLMVGTLEPRKGHSVALAAFQKLWHQGTDVELHIVGRMGWNSQHLVEQMRTCPEWGKKLFWNESVSDAQLRIKYNEADCLIAASYAEGFGLPIVEAGYFNKPIIASGIPVFREVAEGVGNTKFFKCGDSADLANLVREFVMAPWGCERDSASLTGIVSWKQSADRLAEIVLNDDWYCTYLPRTDRSFHPIRDAVDVRMEAPLGAGATKHSLFLRGGPLAGETADTVRFIVEVRNDSDVIWASRGREDGSLSVNLVARLVSQSGGNLPAERRTYIPYVCIPNHSVFLGVEVPAGWVDRVGHSIEVEMVQEGVSWWGNPLTIHQC